MFEKFSVLTPLKQAFKFSFFIYLLVSKFPILEILRSKDTIELILLQNYVSKY